MKKIIAGNWKMNTIRAEGVALAEGLAKGVASESAAFEMVVCPPAIWLDAVAGAVKNSAVKLGGQDCHAQDKGAFTGNISAPMLKDMGCTYVIVGHSERRQYHGETDDMVKAKAEAALKQGLIPIVCVGETEAQRTAGQQNDVVGQQIAGSVPNDKRVVIAYEPGWAIGTGKTATNDDVAAMHQFMRGVVTKQIDGGAGIPLLNGGSVKAANAKEILHLPDVNGVLVGGASLQSDEFLAIANAA